MRKLRSVLFAIAVLTLSCQASAMAADKAAPAQKEDARLLQKVTLAEKGVALSDLCAGLQQRTGVELSASRAVADEKVTVFVDERPAREVMREVARLFGYFWIRSGHEGKYRYELDQDLRSQLAEEELRNRDRDAALVALDVEMQKYRPYVDMSFEQLQKLSEQEGESAKALFGVVHYAGWAGMQLYFRLTPSERAALAAGQEVVFTPDASDPDHRLPAEWERTILQSWQSKVTLNDRSGRVRVADVPGISVSRVKLKLNHTELGAVSLDATVAAGFRDGWMIAPRQLATGRSPSVDNPANARVNAVLRSRAPFARVVSWQPEHTCPREQEACVGGANSRPPAMADGERRPPHVVSADVWEAVHRASGLPIVADAYTHLYPVGAMTEERKLLFDALCQVGDALGVRWTKDGDFLLCRSTSYFWDKLKEVPNRYLRRWARDRVQAGGLLLADFLEMASLTDQQLDSAPVADGIEHCWGIKEWGYYRVAAVRSQARFLALLTTEQQRLALQPAGLPCRELTPAQQDAAVQLTYDRIVNEAWYPPGVSPPPLKLDSFANATVCAYYIPGDAYTVWVPQQYDKARLWAGMFNPVSGRTSAEATAAARRLYPDYVPDEIRRADQDEHILFSVGVGRAHPRGG